MIDEKKIMRDRIDIGDELCSSRIVSIHMLTTDQVKKIQHILGDNSKIDIIMTFNTVGE